MTDDERKMLKDLHEALLVVPVGSPPGALALLPRVHRALRAYDRASYVARGVLYLSAGGVGLMAFWDQVVERLWGAR